MAHGVADKAHAPQHQEDSDRAGAEAQADAGNQGTPHEAVIGKGRQEDVVDHSDASVSGRQASAFSSQLSAIARARLRFPADMTSSVRPQATSSRAISSVS